MQSQDDLRKTGGPPPAGQVYHKRSGPSDEYIPGLRLQGKVKIENPSRRGKYLVDRKTFAGSSRQNLTHTDTERNDPAERHGWEAQRSATWPETAVRPALGQEAASSREPGSLAGSRFYGNFSGSGGNGAPRDRYQEPSVGHSADVVEPGIDSQSPPITPDTNAPPDRPNRLSCCGYFAEMLEREGVREGRWEHIRDRVYVPHIPPYSGSSVLDLSSSSIQGQQRGPKRGYLDTFAAQDSTGTSRNQQGELQALRLPEQPPVTASPAGVAPSILATTRGNPSLAQLSFADAVRASRRRAVRREPLHVQYYPSDISRDVSREVGRAGYDSRSGNLPSEPQQQGEYQSRQNYSTTQPTGRGSSSDAILGRHLGRRGYSNYRCRARGLASMATRSRSSTNNRLSSLSNEPANNGGRASQPQIVGHPAISSSSPDLLPLTPPLDLAEAADNASALLELFSVTKPDDDNEIGDEHRRLITGAVELVLKINTQIKVLAARQGCSQAMATESEETKVDVGCIICYSGIADMLLIPCKHLVMCLVRGGAVRLRDSAVWCANKRHRHVVNKWGYRKRVYSVALEPSVHYVGQLSRTGLVPSAKTAYLL